MRLVSAIFLLVVFGDVNGQSEKEFEGIIRYKHSYLFNSAVADTSEWINALGRSSTLYYKNGNYKWVMDSGGIEAEYFDDKTQTTFSTLKNNDTLFRGRINGHNDSLVGFNQVSDKVVVCGYLCNIVETYSVTKDDTSLSIKRILFYSDSIPIGKNRFHSYRSYGSNRVFEKIKSWPLKIQLEGVYMPFIYTIEAIEIIPMKLSESEVYLPLNRPIKKNPRM